MNPFHDSKTGEFSSGGGGGGVPTDRLNRFVNNAAVPERHAWMGPVQRPEQGALGKQHARQDAVTSRAHEHISQPTFGKRK